MDTARGAASGWVYLVTPVRATVDPGRHLGRGHAAHGRIPAWVLSEDAHESAREDMVEEAWRIAGRCSAGPMNQSTIAADRGARRGRLTAEGRWYQALEAAQ